MSCFRMQRAFVFGLAFFVWATLPIFHVGIDVRAQQSNAAALASDEREKAIKLYTAGETKKAVEALRAVVKKRKDDADAWYYLGLALNRNADAKNARKAFETSIKLRPDFANAHAALAYTLILFYKFRDAEREAQRALALDTQNYEALYIVGLLNLQRGSNAVALNEANAALKIKADYSPGLLLKASALIGVYGDRIHDFHPIGEDGAAPNEKQLRDARLSHAKEGALLLKEAGVSLEKLINLNPKDENVAKWREQIEALHAYSEIIDKPESERAIFLPDEVTTKVTFLSKPEGAYTDAAKYAGITGAVAVHVVLASDGMVKHIIVLKSLGGGLTEEAIKAARRIKFVPAVKDNRPVSTAVTIEYSFNLY